LTTERGSGGGGNPGDTNFFGIFRASFSSGDNRFVMRETYA
jgi:hypothetical protein